VVNNVGAFSLQAGTLYVEGVRVAFAAMPLEAGSLPKKVWLDVGLVQQGADMVADMAVTVLPPEQAAPDYADAVGNARYRVPLAEIAADGTVTDLRRTEGVVTDLVAYLLENGGAKEIKEHLESASPHGLPLAGGEPGQVLIKQNNGSIAWGNMSGVAVGDLCWSSTGKPSPGCVAANVKQKFVRGLYPQLVARVLADGGYLTDEAAWDAEAAAQEGSCGRYALTDTHIILPCHKHHFAAAQDGVAGKEAGDWAGDELLAHRHNNGVGDYEVSHNIYGITSADVPGEATRALQSYNYVPTFQGLTSTVGGAENRPKTSYLLPCIKVADVAVNAAQVDLLALAAQVAQINGDKVDKGDAEYRSIVELKGARGATGTWTIADLIVGKPLFVSLTDTSDDGVLYRVVSGTLDAVTTSTSRYHGMASRANFTSVTPSSFTLVPTASVVEIYIQSIQTGATLRAYQ
ncbi:MAG: hypothetical protein ACK5JO_07595, partial [Halodesulfovibrio sp.]